MISYAILDTQFCSFISLTVVVDRSNAIMMISSILELLYASWILDYGRGKGIYIYSSSFLSWPTPYLLFLMSSAKF